MNITIFKRWNNYRIVKRGFEHASKMGETLLGVPLMVKPNIEINNFEIDDSRYDEDIANFIRKFEKNLKENFKGVNLSLFYNNMNTLNVKKLNSADELDIKLVEFGDKDSHPSIDYGAAYNNKMNEVFYFKISDEELGHEFFHVASSIIIGDKWYSGFMQEIPVEGKKNTYKCIGKGLMEGYTQILTERYCMTNYSNAYLFTKFFVGRLEEIIGQDVMERLYLQADLDGLVKELEKYNTRDNIISFIYVLDKVTNFYLVYENCDLEGKKIVQYYYALAFKYMRDFLFASLINKINIEKNNCDANVGDLKKLMIKFIDNFWIDCSFDGKLYSLLPITDVIKYSSKVRKIK